MSDCILHTIPEQREDVDKVQKVTLEILIFMCGLIGNAVALFVIVSLKEYKKQITYWYVLQLAIADSLFLLTMPFKISEDINNAWIYKEWLCKVKEGILFLNYYASVIFLTVMSLDRYIAVCKPFATNWQKLRKPKFARIITASVWILSLLLCTPIFMYSYKVGLEPNCKCMYYFPKNTYGETSYGSNYNDTYYAMDEIVESQSQCKSLNLPQYDSSLSGSGSGSGSGNSGYNMDFLDYDNNIFEEPSMNSIYVNPTAANSPCELNAECHYEEISQLFINYLYMNFVVWFLIPLMTMAICYGSIIKKILKSNAPIRRPSASSVKSGTIRVDLRKKSSMRKLQELNDTKKRATVLCISLMTTFVVCWLLFHSTHMAKIAGIVDTENRVCRNLFDSGSLMAYLNSALNPFIYNLLKPNFTNRLRKANYSFRKKLYRTSSSGNEFVGLKRLKANNNRFQKSSNKSKYNVSTNSRTSVNIKRSDIISAVEGKSYSGKDQTHNNVQKKAGVFIDERRATSF